MDERQTDEGSKEETAVKNSDGGSKPPVETEAEKVRTARENLKSENDAYEEEKMRGERLRSERILGGGSLAGQPEKTPEDLNNDKVKAMSDEIVSSFR
jgi:hypothetical protein